MPIILFPTALEAGPFLGMVESGVESVIGRRGCITGRVSGREVTVCISGIGQANTAQAVTAIIERCEPDLIILAGCAGAFAESGLAVGDVAAASSETFAELGIHTTDGFIGFETTGLPIIERDGVKYYSTFPTRGIGGIKSGPFLTVASITGTRERAAELYARYGAVCENMEGGAAAQVALLYGVSFIEIRGISNIVGERDKTNWDIPLAVGNCAKTLMEYI